MDAAKQLTQAIRARVPVIAIETPEEDRVLDLMVEISTNPRFPDPRKPSDSIRPIFVWDIATGFYRIGDGAGPEQQDICDPIAALQFVLAWGKDENVKNPAIFLMCDFGPYLGNATVERLLRRCAFEFRKRPQNVILAGPTLVIPPGLKQDVTILNFPYPTVEELTWLVNAKADAMEAQGIEVDLNGNTADVARALAGLTYARAEQAIRKAIIASGKFDDSAIPIILTEKASVIRESGALEYYHQQAEWNEIGGLDILKSYARRAMNTFDPAAQEFGVTRRRGILLVGLPGCGKSLTAKAIAGGKIPLIRLDVAALFGGLVGQSEGQTRQAFKVIEAVGRCIVWIDEIEKALASGDHDGGTSQRVLGTILTWMEESKAPALVIATANDISRLRPELVRRFDEMFFVDLPDRAARAEIIEIHLSKRGRDPQNFDTAQIVTATAQFTGAEIEQIITEAIAVTYDENEGSKDITTDDLLREAKLTIPLIKSMSEEMQSMRRWATRARAASSTQEVGIGSTATVQLEL